MPVLPPNYNNKLHPTAALWGGRVYDCTFVKPAVLTKKLPDSQKSVSFNTCMETQGGHFGHFT